MHREERHPLWTLIFSLIDLPEQRLELLGEPVHVALLLLTALPPPQHTGAQQEPQGYAEDHPSDEAWYGDVLRSAHCALASMLERLDDDWLGARAPGPDRAGHPLPPYACRDRRHAEQPTARDCEQH